MNKIQTLECSLQAMNASLLQKGVFPFFFFFLQATYLSLYPEDLCCPSVCLCTGGHGKSLDLEPKVAASLGHWQLEATERMPLRTLAMALATGKTTSEFNVLDKNEIRVDTYFSLSPDREAA